MFYIGVNPSVHTVLGMRMYASFRRAANGGANAIMRDIQKMFFNDIYGKKIHPPIIPPVGQYNDEEAADFTHDTVDYDKEMDLAIKSYMMKERKGISEIEIEDIQADFLLYFIKDSKMENDKTISEKIPNLYKYIQDRLLELDPEKPGALEEFQGKIKNVWGLAAKNYVMNERNHRNKDYQTESGEATSDNNYTGILDIFLEVENPEAQLESAKEEDKTFLEELYSIAYEQPNSAELIALLDACFSEGSSGVRPGNVQQLEEFLLQAQKSSNPGFALRITKLKEHLAKGSLTTQIKMLEAQMVEEYRKDKNSELLKRLVEKRDFLSQTLATNKRRFRQMINNLKIRARRKTDIQYAKDAIHIEAVQAMINLLNKGEWVSGRKLTYENPTAAAANQVSSLPRKLRSIAEMFQGAYTLRVAADAQGTRETRFPIFETAADMKAGISRLFPEVKHPAFLEVFYSISNTAPKPTTTNEDIMAKQPAVKVSSKTAKRIEAFLWSAGRNPKTAHMGTLQKLLRQEGYKIVKASYGDENEGYESYNDFDDDYEGYEEEAPFADPGGRSALRAGDRVHPCPNCGEENRLSAADVRRGYQCDRCADMEEGAF